MCECVLVYGQLQTICRTPFNACTKCCGAEFAAILPLMFVSLFDGYYKVYISSITVYAYYGKSAHITAHSVMAKGNRTSEREKN